MRLMWDDTCDKGIFNRFPGALQLPSPNLPLQVLPPQSLPWARKFTIAPVNGGIWLIRVSLILISSLLLLDELGSLGGSGMESRRRRLLGKEDSCSGMINLKKQQLWVKEIRTVQDIPSAAEVAETIFHAPGCVGTTLKGIPDCSCTWLTAKQVFSYETWAVLEFSLRHAESFRHAHSVSHAPNTANRRTCPTMSKASPWS